MAPRAKKQEAPQEVSLQELELRTTRITLVGTSTLICHRFGEAAKQKMRAKQQQSGDTGRAVKNPKSDFMESLYVVKAGKTFETSQFGFPATALKNAAVAACRHSEFMTMAAAKGAFHVDGVVGEHGNLIPIKAAPPRMREDTVRVGRGVADLRYRGEFIDWEMTLNVEYNARAISLEQLIHLFDSAGFHVGIGEWRPGSPMKPGPHGRFRVKR